MIEEEGFPFAKAEVSRQAHPCTMYLEIKITYFLTARLRELVLESSIISYTQNINTVI